MSIENKYWLNADGWDHADSGYFADENADDYSADEAADAAYFADASGHGKSAAGVSPPYIVTVQNTNTAAATNVSLFNAYINRTLLTTSGCPANSSTLTGYPGLFYSSPLLSAGYMGLLAQSENKVFVCGEIYIMASTAAIALVPINVTHTDASGKTESMPYIPIIDPNWYQTGIIILHVNFRIDGYTNVQISTMAANSSITYYFYPSKKVDPGKALMYNTIQQGYKPPKLMQGQTTVLVKK
jgi:hypothetical protein